MSRISSSSASLDARGRGAASGAASALFDGSLLSPRARGSGDAEFAARGVATAELERLDAESAAVLSATVSPAAGDAELALRAEAASTLEVLPAGARECVPLTAETAERAGNPRLTGVAAKSARSAVGATPLAFLGAIDVFARFETSLAPRAVVGTGSTALAGATTALARLARREALSIGDALLCRPATARPTAVGKAAIGAGDSAFLAAVSGAALRPGGALVACNTSAAVSGRTSAAAMAAVALAPIKPNQVAVCGAQLAAQPGRSAPDFTSN
jgi:hypothetical protein